jgi:hypothetical protein
VNSELVYVNWISGCVFGNLRPHKSDLQHKSFAQLVDLGHKLKPRRYLWLAIPLLWSLTLWAAWAVRLWRLDASDLTFDEAATYLVAYRPLPDIITYLRQAVREHPPAYYLLVRLWMSLAGTSEYSLRFFAVGASMVGIALTTRLARMLARRLKIAADQLFLAAFLPALILALFPFEVYYARDARMYTLVIVWATLSSLLFLGLLFDQQRGGRPILARLLGLVFVNALALFTHYYLLLLVVTQFVSLSLLRRWRALLGWSVAHGLMGLVGLVWLLRSPGLSSSLTEAWGRLDLTWPTVNQLRRLLADLLFGPVRGVPWVLIYAWGGLVALGLLMAWLLPARADHRTKDRELRRVGTWLTVTILLPPVLAFFMPEAPRSRYLVYVLPFAALALGQIPFMFSAHRTTVLVWLGLLVMAVSSLGIFGLPRTVKWIKSNYGRTITTIDAHARPGDGVLFYGPWQWAQFHYYQPDEFPPVVSLPPYAPPLLDPEEAEPVLRQLLDVHQRLWVIPAAVEDVDPDHFVSGWLNSYAHPVWNTHELSLYLPPAENEALSLPIALAFGDRLRLEHLTGDARRVPAGESLRFALTWAVSKVLDGDVQLDLSLVDEQGNRWQQWHSVPREWSNSPATWQAGDVITDRQGVIVPQGAPPGTFKVQLTVVDLASGAPLRPSDVDGPLAQVGVDLFSFQVVEPVTDPVLIEVGDFAGSFTFRSPDEAPGVLTLAGYELGGLAFQQGNHIPLWLHWLAPVETLPDLKARLQLQHRSRVGLFESQISPLVTRTLPLAPGYPAPQWSSGRLVSLPTALSIPPDAPPGRVDLTLELVGADGQPWKIDGEQHVTLGALTIEERPMLRRLPRDLTAVEVDFATRAGDEIGLRGYRIEGRPQPGGQLSLHYAWYALSQPGRVYSVFNHLLTADGQRVAQIDGWPQDGLVLTKQWRQGEYIQDSHTLEIPLDAPPGPYQLLVGLYDAATGERMRLSQEGQLLPEDQWVVPLDVGD